VLTPTVPTPVTTVRGALSGISAILSKEGVKAIHCFGLSMGGMLEQVLLREHPEQVQSLILFHCPPPSQTYAQVIERTMRANRVMPMWLSQLLRRYLMAREMRGYSDVPDEEKHFWSEYYRGTGSRDRSFNQLSIVLDYLRNYSFAEDDLQAWPGRIMIIETATDSIIPEIERSRLKALYPQAKVHTYPTGDHLGNGLFKIATTIALVKDFLCKAQ
jgi:pimeloyl-ACP methyl ester carboxylesterase